MGNQITVIYLGAYRINCGEHIMQSHYEILHRISDCERGLLHKRKIATRTQNSEKSRDAITLLIQLTMTSLIGPPPCFIIAPLISAVIHNAPHFQILKSMQHTPM